MYHLCNKYRKRRNKDKRNIKIDLTPKVDRIWPDILRAIVGANVQCRLRWPNCDKALHGPRLEAGAQGGCAGVQVAGVAGTRQVLWYKAFAQSPRTQEGGKEPRSSAHGFREVRRSAAFFMGPGLFSVTSSTATYDLFFNPRSLSLHSTTTPTFGVSQWLNLSSPTSILP